MTKKDFQAIAREMHKMIEAARTTTATPEQTARYCAARIADVLQADNPRFDRARFIEACETGKCKGMKS